MSHIKFIKTLIMLSLAFSLTACSESYDGPIAERPVTDEGRNGEAPVTKTLFQKVLEKGVPEIPLRKAFDYFDANKNIIKNQKYMSIIDFSQHSGQKRFYLIDMSTGAVDKILTAHGRGSDPDHTGIPKKFSNVSSSNMTSLGFMLAAERYIGDHGVSLRLDGLESINSNARPRAIVIHGADYVDPSRPKMGRSLGCPAVENRLIVSLVKKIENGSLVYSYYTGL
ncbi:MAG: murein L,D-transpeptidase catalytic domain family protein [Bdellovibrionota bacterium]